MRTGNYPYTLLLLLVVCMMTGCGDRAREDSFDEIETRIGNDPKTAVRFVDSLNADIGWKEGMNAAERARFDLLRIKSADKAYVRHTSDSLIRTVLGYYEKHTGSEQYPEALYYGGRVYSDLGDSPTALRYFQQALDALSGEGDLRLRSTVLSQTARLMNRMRMYDQAQTYLKEVIAINEQSKDTASLAYDYELSGAIYMHTDSLDQARILFDKALALSEPGSGMEARQYTYLAAIQYERGNFKDAARLISGMPGRISGTYRTTSMGYAAQIYLETGQYDSAIYYADKILQEKDTRNHRIAYGVLLSPRLRSLLPPDSVGSYYLRYGEEIAEFADNNNREACAIGNAVYNYSIHERERQKEEIKKNRYAIAGLILLTAVLALCLTIIYIRHRNRRNRLDLYEALENIMILRDLLKSANARTIGTVKDVATAENGNISAEHSGKFAGILPAIKEEERLRRKLRAELQELISVSSGHSRPSRTCILPKEITESETYVKLRGYLNRGEELPSGASLWEELTRLTNEIWPDFHDKLSLLIGSKINENDYHLCLLIRLGFSPTEIALLLRRTKGTISSRRARLCKEILGENAGANRFDIIVLSL